MPGCGLNTGAIVPFLLRRAAGQYHARVVLLSHVVSKRGVVLGAPVSIISEPLAAAWTDHAKRSPVSGDPLCKPLICGRRRDIPTENPFAYPQMLDKAEQPVHDVLSCPRRNAGIGEQPLVITSPCSIEAEPNVCANHATHEIGAHRSMHMQQQRKLATGQTSLDFGEFGKSSGFIESDKLDAFHALHQAVLGVADDPGDRRARPSRLNGSDYRQSVAAVTDRGEPDYTYRIRWALQWKGHAGWLNASSGLVRA